MPARGAAGPPGRSIIERIKERCTCADLLGVDVAGRHHVMVCCPLHDDHNPSMIVYGNDGKCRCLAGCEGGKQLDTVDLYAAMNGIPPRQAIRELADRLGL
jgi:DNA primase